MSLVVESWAVTRTVIALDPTLRAMAALAVPLATAVPPTTTVAAECAIVGVSFKWVVALGTVAK